MVFARGRGTEEIQNFHSSFTGGLLEGALLIMDIIRASSVYDYLRCNPSF